MSSYHATNQARLPAAIVAAAVPLVAFWMLATSRTISHHYDPALTMFDVAPTPPPRPEPVKQHPVESKKAEGASAPPNLRSKATEVVAPPPVILMPLPSPVIAAPLPGLGAQARAGAADVAGPGSGAGGVGNGTGSGGSGNGEGAGGIAREAYQKSGRIKDSDFPKSIPRGWRGTVYVDFTVEADGRATACRVARTSGNGEIDATTCRLIEERYRYEPARDRAGKKIRSRVEGQDHTWVSAGNPQDGDR
ncbi:energy transducer TonB [Sphingomonas immobilis]|uniref:TonB family protein n=1 Tax=Sphingomonas immobilis TaxID=3063997 RepID=A0ABT8ZZ12_9SPHN|nr:TonB family protein [Sphingomonas sp. CA1-15]MDO7842523.1 TonB family protein [Sphingomonas sp. CA1-15]